MPASVETAPTPLKTYTLFPSDFEAILSRVSDLQSDILPLTKLVQDGSSFDPLYRPKLAAFVRQTEDDIDAIHSFVGELAQGVEVTVRPFPAIGDTPIQGLYTEVGISSGRLEEVQLRMEVFLELLTANQSPQSKEEFKEKLRKILNTGRSVGFKNGED